MLNEAGVEHDIKVYPARVTAFLNDRDPAALPVWVNATVKLAAASFHEPWTRDARRRIVRFCEAQLRG